MLPGSTFADLIRFRHPGTLEQRSQAYRWMILTHLTSGAI
jgi:hypothetical protein